METNKEKAIQQFKILGPVSIIYSLFFVFCLYKNFYGITSPIWAVATVLYMYYISHKLKKSWKLLNTFFSIAIALLGISNFITGNSIIIFFNYVAIIFLIIINMIYLFVDTKNANFSRHLELFVILGIGTLSEFPSPLPTAYEDYLKNRHT